MKYCNLELVGTALILVFSGALLAIYIIMISILWDFPTKTMIYGGQKKPMAADFANYWSAAKLALSGNPITAYKIKELHKIQQQYFGTHHSYMCGWYYPPTFLLMMLGYVCWWFFHLNPIS
jgi:hypothetical protein